MDVVHPGALLQQLDHKPSLIDSKCSSQWSAVDYISAPRVVRKTAYKSSPSAKSKESLKCNGFPKQPCDDVTDVSRFIGLDASGAKVAPKPSHDLVVMDNSAQKLKKKNKKKKGKNAKMSETVSAETLTTNCAEDITRASSQSSKEGGNEKDDITTTDDGCPFDLTGSSVLSESDGWNCNNDDALFPGRYLNGVNQGEEGPKPIDKKIFMQCDDRCSKDIKENISVTCMSQNKSHRNDANRCNRQSISYRNSHAVASNKRINMMSQPGIADKSGWDCNIRTEKEICHPTWQDNRKSFRDAPTRWVKVFSAGHDIAGKGVETVNNRPKFSGSTHSNESPRQSSQKIHGGLCQFDSGLAQDACGRNLDWRKFKGTHNHSLKRKIINNRKLNAGGYNSAVPGQSLSRDVHSYNSLKISVNEQVIEGTSPISLEDGQSNPARLDINLSAEDNIRNCPHQGSSQQWIPICTKNSTTMKNSDSSGACNDIKVTSSLGMEKTDVQVEENKVNSSASVATVDPGTICLITSHEIPTVMPIKNNLAVCHDTFNRTEESDSNRNVRDYVKPVIQATNAPLLSIGSQFRMKALDAAYRLQMVSESVQHETGSPLAEFERLVYSAAPVISPAFSVQGCSICVRNQLSHSSLCKHQIPNIPLSTIWNWYEKPGSYGLEVMAHDHRNSEGVDTNSVSFTAHFVPFLSSVPGQSLFVELFKDDELSLPSLFTGSSKSCWDASFLFKSGAEPVRSPDICPASVTDSAYLSSTPTCSDNMELLFEFFETDGPQLRKPLYDKVMELIKGGTSNHKVFGDPSNLERMNLHDLHPASWYSVAWYPIYRIPEGKFRASFLTYHSLGYLVQRCSIDSEWNEQSSSIISPVLGLESYNTHGECWFCPRKRIENSKENTIFNSSDILKERLKTLEETALLFARGSICKDRVISTNQQLDYEFFRARKR
ncbi:hypothetical protein MKW94_016190 [Papaver nudicaule]|uniref:Uncharacterized protein n=1 Tax=Papaver nudicaule TaxID=74823 RepID=A0AA41VFU6_PAPNU|nr:hypothetical protein [Papaver nudicaule]